VIGVELIAKDVFLNLNRTLIMVDSPGLRGSGVKVEGGVGGYDWLNMLLAPGVPLPTVTTTPGGLVRGTPEMAFRFDQLPVMCAPEVELRLSTSISASTFVVPKKT
jgi:hypothetical protein